MAWVDTKGLPFSLRLNEDVMRGVLNGASVRQELRSLGDAVRAGVETHVRATTSAGSADNYVESMFHEDAFSDEYGFDFDGPYGLGNRPIQVVGVPAGRGVNPAAKPPLMVEAETHALSSVAGFTVGSSGEDIR